MFTRLAVFVATAIGLPLVLADCACEKSGAHYDCGGNDHWDVLDSRVDGISFGHSWENACDACAARAAKSWSKRRTGGKRCYYCKSGWAASGIWLKSSGTHRVHETPTENIVRCSIAGSGGKIIETEVDIFDQKRLVDINDQKPFISLKHLPIIAGVVGFIAFATVMKFIMQRKVLTGGNETGMME